MIGRPIGDYVLIHVDEEEETTSGGIVMPDTARRRNNNQIGKVVATGEGRRTLSGELIPCTVKEGDRVMFPAGGITMSFEDVKYALVKSADLWMVWNGDTSESH